MLWCAATASFREGIHVHTCTVGGVDLHYSGCLHCTVAMCYSCGAPCYGHSFCYMSRSVNEVICHGIPDMRPLEDGDICNSEPEGSKTIWVLHLLNWMSVCGIIVNLRLLCYCNWKLLLMARSHVTSPCHHVPCKLPIFVPGHFSSRQQFPAVLK